MPTAWVAARQRIGTSSIAPATSSGLTSMRSQAPTTGRRSRRSARPRIAVVGPGAGSRHRPRSSMSAPIRTSRSTSPRRVGLAPDVADRQRPRPGAPPPRPSRRRRRMDRPGPARPWRGRRSARPPRPGRRRPRPSSGHRRREPGASARCDRAWRPTRERASCPPAPRPASRIADFTCADGTGVVQSTAVRPSRRPRWSGGRPSAPPASMRAPIARNGSTTRAIGRRRRDASPSSVASAPRPGEDPGEQPQARAGVPAIEGACRSWQSGGPGRDDAIGHRAAVLGGRLDDGAEGPDDRPRSNGRPPRRRLPRSGSRRRRGARTSALGG